MGIFLGMLQQVRVHRKHTLNSGWGFTCFGGSHAVETTVAVGLLSCGRVSSIVETALLLGWFIGLGGCIQLLGALVGIMASDATFITSDG